MVGREEPIEGSEGGGEEEGWRKGEEAQGAVGRARRLCCCGWGGGNIGGECGGIDVSGLRSAIYEGYLLIANRLGAVYNAGGFKMSTWIPFVWSLISVLVLILSSFSIQGGL